MEPRLPVAGAAAGPHGAGAAHPAGAGGVVHFSQAVELPAGVTPFVLPLNEIKAKGVLFARLDMAVGVSGTTRMVVE
ncbi:MAG: hypothetical protein L6Q97_20500 [Thermoanaerobaculia bacterium]|nr:hypothetical protein [Thermoanaerobaculia bacterium]